MLSPFLQIKKLREMLNNLLLITEPSKQMGGLCLESSLLYSKLQKMLINWDELEFMERMICDKEET